MSKTFPNRGKPLMDTGLIFGFVGVEEAVFAPANVGSPKSMDDSVQIGIELSLFRSETTDGTIARPKRRQDFSFEIFFPILGIVHELRLKDPLHDCITEKNIVSGSVEIEDTHFSTGAEIQIAVADISLHSILSVLPQRGKQIHIAVVGGNNLVKEQLCLPLHKRRHRQEALKIKQIIVRKRIKQNIIVHMEIIFFRDIVASSQELTGLFRNLRVYKLYFPLNKLFQSNKDFIAADGIRIGKPSIGLML